MRTNEITNKHGNVVINESSKLIESLFSLVILPDKNVFRLLLT